MRKTEFMVYALFLFSLLIVVIFVLFTIAVGFAIVANQGVRIIELICIALFRKETSKKYDRHAETQILMDKKTRKSVV